MEKKRLNNIHRTAVLLFVVFALLIAGCEKVEYTTMESPAYLRVFNNLNYAQTMEHKETRVPFLCMLVNPEFDASGKPIDAEIVGDFLDLREMYAPPYPSHIGNSTSMNNPEYPGKENVLVGPVLNGFDLSSWAQVPSGELRVLFLYRPKNEIPYFRLEDHLQNDVVVDTTINLQAGEVYTLHVLQKAYQTNQIGALLRQENFHKIPLSDSLVYVNFYNYSAAGFAEADESQKPTIRGQLNQAGISEETNVFLTLFRRGEGTRLDRDSIISRAYNRRYFATIKRDTESDATAPYYHFPLWLDTRADGIHTAMYPFFDFVKVGLEPEYVSGTFGHARYAGIYWANAWFADRVYQPTAGTYPNLIVNIHSGEHNPRSFATVNTVEIVNNCIYLTTVQRKYPGPIY